MNHPKTRSAAIAAKCKDCIHDPQAAGTWRTQVALCGIADCALWNFRPMPAKGTAIPEAVLKFYSITPDDPAAIDLTARGYLQNRA